MLAPGAVVAVAVVLVVAVAVVAAAAATGVRFGAGLPAGVVSGWRRRGATHPAGGGRVLVPFTGQELSRRAFDAAVAFARAQHATIVPAFLARVPRRLPLDAPLPAQCDGAMALMEALEQRAERDGVAVDARVGRGRSYRDALHRLLADEPFDRIVVCAPDGPRRGLTYEDLRWLLTRVPAEIVILKPAPSGDPAQAVKLASAGSRPADASDR